MGEAPSSYQEKLGLHSKADPVFVPLDGKEGGKKAGRVFIHLLIQLKICRISWV
jgi:hypothetical protein